MRLLWPLISRLIGGVIITALSMAQLYASEPAAKAATPQRIVVLGDSISAGFGVPLQQGWVALLSKELKNDVTESAIVADIEVINASISGDTTHGGISRLPALLSQHQPQLVIIELGGNDGLRGMPLKVIRNNLARLIEFSQQAGSEVLLAGMQIPPNYGARYTQGFAGLYAELAEQYQTRLIPFLLSGLLDASQSPPRLRTELFQADGIHPTAEAQPLIMQPVLSAIRQWQQQKQTASQ